MENVTLPSKPKKEELVYNRIMSRLADIRGDYGERKHQSLNPIDYIKAEAAENAIMDLYEELAQCRDHYLG